MAQPPPQSIANFRDVGDSINTISNRPLIRRGLLFRSARPDDASFQDRKRLVEEFNIRTIIDLRTETEHINQAQRRNARISSSAAAPQSNDEAAEPLQIPGIKYQEINFNGNGFSWMLLSQLTWFEFFRLLLLMLLGYRDDAIKILAPKMNSMGLVGIAKSSLDVCKKEVKQVFDVLTEPTNYPVLVHCTQGKDRTGLVVMLVLFVLRFEEGAADIAQDYLESEKGLASEKEEMLKELEKVGLSETFTKCPAEMVEEVHAYLQQNYGGTDKYLLKAGLDWKQINTLRTILSWQDSDLPDSQQL